MLCVRKPVVDVVAGRIGQGCVGRIVKGCICRIAWFWEGEWEPSLCGAATRRLESAIGTGDKRLVEERRLRRNPIKAERRVPNLVEKVQVLDRGVIDTVGSTDTGLARATEYLPCESITKPGRIRNADPGRKIVVAGWRQR